MVEEKYIKGLDSWDKRLEFIRKAYHVNCPVCDADGFHCKQYREGRTAIPTAKECQCKNIQRFAGKWLRL